MAARQFIYHMRGLTKAYAGGKKVLENVNLSFYPEAKIGVLGVNGSGKSTLLRVMAGIDKEFNGEGFVADGARVGYLPQEPPLDPALDVRGNVMLGVKAKTDLLERYNELAMNYSDETADEMTRLQDEIEAQGLWDLDSQVEQAMEALGCPPDDADVTTLSGGERRRVALCKLLLEKPELLLLDEPTNHLDAETVNWLEGPSARLSRRHPDRHPRSLLPRQRDGLDSGAGSRQGHPLRGQLFGVAEGQAEAHRAGKERGRLAHPRHRRGGRMDGRLAQGATGQEQGAHPALRRSRRPAERQIRDRRDHRDPGLRAAGNQGHRVRGASRRRSATAC